VRTYNLTGHAVCFRRSGRTISLPSDGTLRLVLQAQPGNTLYLEFGTLPLTVPCNYPPEVVDLACPEGFDVTQLRPGDAIVVSRHTGEYLARHPEILGGVRVFSPETEIDTFRTRGHLAGVRRFRLWR
jgi:hypothetical protein